MLKNSTTEKIIDVLEMLEDYTLRLKKVIFSSEISISRVHEGSKYVIDNMKKYINNIKI